MKRTKRYGGFLIGDRVKTKHDYNIGNGEVVGMREGYLLVKFIVLGNSVLNFAFMPNQLINLTRQEEEFDKFLNEGEIEIPLSKEEAKEIEERLKRMEMENWKPEDHNIMPYTPFVDLITGTIEEREAKLWKLKERVAKLEMETANILTPDPLPSPYPRDVYTTTNDY